MRYRMIICALAVVTMGTCSQSLLASPTTPYFNVACEGTKCTGGGVSQYEYSVKNVFTATESLVIFYIGTDDPNSSNYTNWVQPTGFSAQVLVNDGNFEFMDVRLSMPNTDHKQFAHTSPHTETGVPTTYVVVWTNAAGTTLTPNQAVTFGFDNPNTYQNTEWVAGDSAYNGDAADAASPIVGPLNTYGRGYAHAPTPEPATLSLLALGGLALLRRRLRK